MAIDRIYSSMMKTASQNKKATPFGDAASQIIYDHVPVIGPGTNIIGEFSGALSKAPTNKEQAQMDEKGDLSFLPGVGAYRGTRRTKRQLTSPQGSTKRFWSSTIGPGTAALLAGLVGGGIGNKLGGSEGITKGVAYGVSTATTVGILASILAAFTKRRTAEQQTAASRSNLGVAADYLIPGYAEYNKWKSYGRAMQAAEDRKNKK